MSQISWLYEMGLMETYDIIRGEHSLIPADKWSIKGRIKTINFQGAP